MKDGTSVLHLCPSEIMKKKKVLLILLEVLAVLAVIAGVFFFQQRAEKQDQALVTVEDTEKRFRPSLIYQDKQYPIKRNISSLLLMGTDNYIDDKNQVPDSSIYNYNHADFVAVLVFDHARKTVTPLQLCRDAMVDVMTVNGMRHVQLTLVHTIGNGKEDSANAMRDTVEKILYNAPIDNFMSFSLEAIPLLNDLVGGVSVTLEEDLPAFGSDFVAGATVTLRGQQAIRFVRTRDTSLLDDNLRRMAHHRQYLAGFTEAARDAASRDQDLAVKAFKLIEKYICTDLTVDGISRLVDNLCNYELMPVVTPPGVYTMGDQYAEFNFDEPALWESVRSVFCEA